MVHAHSWIVTVVAAFVPLGGCKFNGSVRDAGAAWIDDGGGADGGADDGGADDGGAADGGAADGGTRDGTTSAEAGETVATLLGEVVDDAGIRSMRYRLERSDGAAGYAQWYAPSVDGGVAPVVVLTKPYEGIDWTGEAVDERWAARGSGSFPDEDSPGYDPASDARIAYRPMTIDEAGESTLLWRRHGFGVLLLFGRFYAGGDVQNDIDDMTMGFDFLAARGDVDRARIGIMGSSWGGFEALYGAAYAAPGARPSVGVAFYPLSDFEVERRYATEILPLRYTKKTSRVMSEAFFDPYLRRIEATRARNQGFDGLRATDLVHRIEAPFLIVHEDWDTLVSIEQTERLVGLAPERFLPLWIAHERPPDPWDVALTTHGPLLSAFAELGVYPLVFAHLLTHLGGPEQSLFVPWDPPSFRSLLELMKERQTEGADIRFFAERLALLCDMRVTIFDASTQQGASGGQLVADELNAVWGTNLTRNEACEKLAASTLPGL